MGVGPLTLTYVMASAASEGAEGGGRGGGWGRQPGLLNRTPHSRQKLCDKCARTLCSLTYFCSRYIEQK